MAYKSILTIITQGSPETAAMDRAAAMARDEDGHLDILCLGVDRTQTGYYYAGANAMVLQETITRATEEAREREEAVRRLLAGSQMKWSVESGVAQLADIGRSVGLRARFSDLVVLPRPYGESRLADAEAVAEGALFDGRAPLLMVPEKSPSGAHPDRIVIAWDESIEAMAAVRAALPLLQAAQQVNVVIIDPPAHAPNRSDPGGQLSQFLVRHGVKTEIDVLSKTMPRTADVLIRHARENGAEMIVMGAYSHSRFREAILGGTTRDMLEESPLPLFMAH